MDFLWDNVIQPNLYNAMCWYLSILCLNCEHRELQYGIINCTEESSLRYTRIYCTLL